MKINNQSRDDNLGDESRDKVMAFGPVTRNSFEDEQNDVTLNTENYEYDGSTILRSALILEQVENGVSNVSLYLNTGKLIIQILIFALNYRQYEKYAPGDFII